MPTRSYIFSILLRCIAGVDNTIFPAGCQMAAESTGKPRQLWRESQWLQSLSYRPWRASGWLLFICTLDSAFHWVNNFRAGDIVTAADIDVQVLGYADDVSLIDKHAAGALETPTKDPEEAHLLTNSHVCCKKQHLFVHNFTICTLLYFMHAVHHLPL